MAFCPSVFKLSFGFWFFPLEGAFVGEVDFGDLEANLFLQCSSCGKVDFVDLETRFFDLLGNLLWCSRFCWLRGINLFLAVYFLVKSISLTSRHDFVSLFGCPRLDEADFVDLEVLIYFLQCTSFGGVDRFDLEARIFAVHLLQWGRFLWPWGTSLIFTVRLLQ